MSGALSTCDGFDYFINKFTTDLNNNTRNKYTESEVMAAIESCIVRECIMNTIEQMRDPKYFDEEYHGE